jgi:hypothetical protein
MVGRLIFWEIECMIEIGPPPFERLYGRFENDLYPDITPLPIKSRPKWQITRYSITEMNLDTGRAVVILAVLVFYLRLIILQRERVKRLRAEEAAQVKAKNKRKPGKQPIAQPPRYSILSPNRRDLIVAGVGLFAIVLGVLLYLKVIPGEALQTYWWIPTALGIVAFSWGFRL